jgi:transglutaminase-like putative cysteine protease
MEVRAMPHTNERQVLRHFEISVSPTAKTSDHRDWLGNTVHQFSILGVHSAVLVTSVSTVETRNMSHEFDELKAPLEGLIRDHRSWDFLQHHGPVMDDPALPALVQRLGLDKVRRVGQAIDLVMNRTRDVITYRRGVTHSGSTVSDVLASGAGVCQDFAHLSLALLRRVGVPCRYVSGYLYREDVASLETHAWAEAFVPGVGWIAFDPTHGIQVTEDYVSVAVGRSYADVPPNRGVYRGSASESINASVSMTRIDECSRLTPYSTAFERPRKRSEPRAIGATPSSLTGLEHQRVHPNAAGFVVQQQRQQQQEDQSLVR